MLHITRDLPWTVMTFALAGLAFGCGEKAPETAPSTGPGPSAEPAAEAPAAKPAEAPAPAEAAKPDPKVLAALAKADAADGKADKVVSKCIGCRLGMDGDAQFATAVGDYKVHLCSTECKGAFDKDPAKAILALKLPEPTEQKK